MFTATYSQLSSAVFNGAHWLKQQWNKSYEQARLILTDELMVYRPEEYFPKDVQNILQRDKELLQAVKAIKRGMKEKQYSNDWLMVLNEVLEQVKEGKLSLCSFILGLEQLQNMESIPGILSDWITFAKGESFKFVSHKQFRLSLYIGLWQVAQNKLEVEDWLRHLETYQACFEMDAYSTFIDKITTFAESYLKSEYQNIVYPIPIYAYQNLFGSIEEFFIIYNTKVINKKNNTALIDYANLLTSSANNLWQWIQNHPRKIVLGGLLASAWYRSQVQDNQYSPLQWTGNIMLNCGVQQTLHIKGIQNFISLVAVTFGTQSLLINAQATTFYTTLTGSKDDEAYALQQSVDGGAFVAGKTNSFGAGDYDGLLAKFAANGTFLWGNTFGENVTDIAQALVQTSDNGLVVVGSTNKFSVYYDIFLVKFAANATLLWAKVLTTPKGSAAFAIIETNDKGLAVAGTVGTGNTEISLLAKFDINGNLAWGTTLYNPMAACQMQAFAVQQTNDQGFIITGQTSCFSAGNVDVFLAKFDSDGNFLWANALGGPYQDAGSYIIQTNDNGFIVSGYMAFPVNGGVSSQTDTLLAKFDANGTFLWANRLYTNQGGAVVLQTNDNNLVIAAQTDIQSIGRMDLLLAKFDTNGNFLLSKTLGKPSQYINSFALKESSDAGLLVTGTQSDGYSSSVLLSKFDANGNLALSCVRNAAPNVSSIPANMSRSITPGFGSWAPLNISLWNTVRVSPIFPTIQQPCGAVPPTPIPTAYSTPMAGTTVTPMPSPTSQTTNSSNRPSTSSGISGSTLPVTGNFPTSVNSSSNIHVVPIAVGVTVGVAALGGLSTGLFFYFKKRKSSNKQLNSEKSRANTITLEPIRDSKVHTIVGKKYALLNKISQEEAKVLKEQTGLEVTFQEGKKKTKFTLGQGQFGKLRLARNVNSQEFVGVKKIKGKEGIEASLQEANVQRKLNGLPNVMPLLDSLEMTGSNDEPVLYQFMPLAGFGNGEFLRKALNACQDEKLKEQMLIQVMYGLLNGFKAMHSKNIYHMDFKPANFVIDQWGEVYIIDFGCAIETEAKEIEGVNGDTRYFSPERLEYYRTNKKFSPAKADIWALGLSFLELAKGVYPLEASNFEQRKQQWNEVYFSQKFETVLELRNPELKSIWMVIKGLLHPDAQKRLNLEQALNLPIFSEAKLRFATKEEGKEQMVKLKEIAQNKVVLTEVSKKDAVDYAAYKGKHHVYLQRGSVENDKIEPQYHVSLLTTNIPSQEKPMLHQYNNTQEAVNNNNQTQNEKLVLEAKKAFSNQN